MTVFLCLLAILGWVAAVWGFLSADDVELEREAAARLLVKIKDLETLLEAEKQTNAVQKQRIEAMQEHRDTECEELLSANLLQKQRIKAMQERHDTIREKLESDREDLREELREARVECEKLESDREDLREELREARVECESMIPQLRSASAALARIREATGCHCMGDD